MAAPGVLVGQQLAVVVDEVFNGGMVVSCAPLGLRGALLEPVGFPVMVAPGSYLANPLSLIHDHSYMEIPNEAKKLIRCIPKKNMSQRSSMKTTNMASQRRKQLGSYPQSPAPPLTTSQPPEGVRSACVLVDPPKPPNCASVGIEGRRAKLMAYEKMVQRVEQFRLPPPVKLKAKKNNVNSHKTMDRNMSRAVCKSLVKVKLTPCTAKMVKTPISCPSSDRKVNSNHHTFKCKKKLDFPLAVSSSLSPSSSSIYSTSSGRSSTPYSSSMSPCYSSPSTSDTMAVASSPRNNLMDSDSGSSLVDVMRLSPVEVESKRLNLKDFSIRLVSMDLSSNHH